MTCKASNDYVECVGIDKHVQTVDFSKVVLKLCLLLISNHHHPPCLSLRAHAVCAPSLLQRVGTLIACSLNIPSGLYFFITLSLLGIMWITGMCECLS